MFNKILIANRGEIACRIIKTARRLGIESVAVYSTVDRLSLHTTLADEAFCIGEPEARASYLNIDRIIEAALASGAEAIHPGYGFLSENPHLARAAEAHGLVFIGPSVGAMEAMASKQLAKQRLEKTTVPLTPGYHGHDQSNERLLAEAERLGFPVLLKAASGGGGKGMRIVHEASDFDEALAGARREAKASFGDETMLIETFIKEPRHVEIQIMADNHGHIVHLYERDCSIQRRHQKIIEEAPAPDLSPLLRQGLADAAIAVARAIDYRGAGTVEFLVDGDQFYFMEMNTRLQVEHPVTEMITGLDLVEWQLRIAANEPLPSTQEQIHAHGHAIECRIYAEDPTHDFLPSIGQLHFLKEPTGEHLRLDSGVVCGSVISRYYDPMIAKLIAFGSTRNEALQRLQQALMHYHIGGIKTNIPFLKAVLLHPCFINAAISTHFLTEHTLDIPTPNKRLSLFMAASVDYLNAYHANPDPVYIDTFGWQMHLNTYWSRQYSIDDEVFTLDIAPIGPHALTLNFNEDRLTLQVTFTEGRLCMEDGHQRHQAWVEQSPEGFTFYGDATPITVKKVTGEHLPQQAPLNNQLTAPMPATVVAILKQKGDKIKMGERLIVLEAMKMEHTIHAPHDGLLLDIFCDIGSQVNEGTELIAMDIVD